MPLPWSAGFDTLSGHLPAFPDYLAERRMFIDWELIKRRPPLTLPPFSFAKGEGFFHVGAIRLSGVKNAFVAASALLLAPSFSCTLCVSLWLLMSLLGMTWKCWKTKRRPLASVPVGCQGRRDCWHQILLWISASGLLALDLLVSCGCKRQVCSCFFSYPPSHTHTHTHASLVAGPMTVSMVGFVVTSRLSSSLSTLFPWHKMPYDSSLPLTIFNTPNMVIPSKFDVFIRTHW